MREMRARDKPLAPKVGHRELLMITRVSMLSAYNIWVLRIHIPTKRTGG